MKKMGYWAVFAASILMQSACFADVPSYFTSPASTKSSTGSSSTGNTSSNPNIVTGDHFSHINPYTGQAGRHNYDINSNETTIDNGYNPVIQLDCTHDDSCLTPAQHK